MDMKQPAVAMAKGGFLAEGGMMQEGGTVDPVSGNEVPVGSLQEEVRDDIPAQLSEGEFVFPADVVRYIGLEKLMQLRQAAKEGLAKMEAMGQMGNSEEATMEDTGEFESEIDDILKEVESEEEED
jgi:Arc/MetJ-type ribon-helix-helix transcriptional regulator